MQQPGMSNFYILDADTLEVVMSKYESSLEHWTKQDNRTS